MLRLLIALICYAAAMTFIWSGLQLAPDMKWPHSNNDTEILAALMVSVGLGAKLLGHLFLFSLSRANQKGHQS